MDQKSIDDFNKILAAIPIEELREKEVKQQKQNAKVFENFERALQDGKCYYCEYPISHFSPKKPCFHWLLKPKGFKKRHFPILFEEKSYRALNTYLRWVANTDKFGQNINDLVEEQSSNRFIEETIKYRNLEWSFSCSDSDRKGHSEAHKGSMPHYHFQMKVDGNVIINYNAFHIPFTDHDELSFAIEAGRFDVLESFRRHDAGMQTLLEQMGSTDDFVDALRYTEDEAEAAFKTDIFIQADPGTTISGNDLADLFEERKRTGDSMAKLVKKLKNVTVQTTVSPAKGVPEIAKRSGGRAKDRDNSKPKQRER